VWLLIEADADRLCVDMVSFAAVAVDIQHLLQIRCARLPPTIVTKFSRGIFRPAIGQGGGSVSRSNGRKYWRARSAMAVVQESRRGRLLRAQASEVSPLDKLESLVYRVLSRCKQGHTCHASAQKTVRVQIARRPPLPPWPSLSSISRLSIVLSICLFVALPCSSLRLHFRTSRS
jgi:hypothetical protein